MRISFLVGCVDVRYIANTKKSFGVAVTTVTQWFAPTPIIISGDESVKDEIKAAPGGLVETHFAERIVFIANHLVFCRSYLANCRYTLTGFISGITLNQPLLTSFRWVSYTSNMHGAIYIILKDSLKWVPIIGWGMQFYGFSIVYLLHI
jgi:lysocardiolipin and lysophospholipid acyltransferase